MDAQLTTLQHNSTADDGRLIRQVLRAIQSVRYGQLHIIVQDSCAAQIDTTEKLPIV